MIGWTRRSALRLAAAALAASLFHFKQLSIMELKEQLADEGVPIRIPVAYDDKYDDEMKQ